MAIVEGVLIFCGTAAVVSFTVMIVASAAVLVKDTLFDG